MRKNIIAVTTLLTMFFFMVCSAKAYEKNQQIQENSAGTLTLNGKEISTQNCDLAVIPDKYNTGCNQTLFEKTVSARGYDGEIFYKTSGDSKLVLDLIYGNNDLQNFVIMNREFPLNSYAVYHAEKVDCNYPRTLTFSNCRFQNFQVNGAADNVKLVFYNCSFKSFDGGDATFYNCYFGGSTIDALRILKDTSVNDCYISNLCFLDFITANGKSYHTDGVQIFGRKDVPAKNIHFNNCRFEVPQLQSENSKGNTYINSCIMTAVEYSSGKNIIYENCHINGGGFSIYATDQSPYTLTDTSFKNISIGCTHVWGDVYYRVGKDVKFDDVSDTSSLYIGSVWRATDGIHMSVTNDTNQVRTLLVYTANGLKKFTIPACPLRKQFSDKTTFDSLPFDMDISVADKKSKWVLCYDVTGGEYTQIRYVKTLN